VPREKFLFHIEQEAGWAPTTSLNSVEKRKKNFLPLPGIKLHLHSHPAHSIITISTQLSLFLFYMDANNNFITNGVPNFFRFKR
jgi:hypothetical protein